MCAFTPLRAVEPMENCVRLNTLRCEGAVARANKDRPSGPRLDPSAGASAGFQASRNEHSDEKVRGKQKARARVYQADPYSLRLRTPAWSSARNV